jgi:hypothetical protein
MRLSPFLFPSYGAGFTPLNQTKQGEGEMRSDSDIKRDVEEELRWDPSVDATDIAVAVKNGVVTLTGFVRNYMDKFQAEAAARRVAGVVGLERHRGRPIQGRPKAGSRDRARRRRNDIKVVVDKGWHTRRAGRVELSARRGGKGGPPDQWRQGRHQLARSPAAG